MNNSEILKLGLALGKENTPDANYMAVVDFSRRANQHRFFLINLKNKEIEYSWYTSHGQGSGGLGKATQFSNIPNSKMSSVGLMKTAETYTGKYGLSLKLDGLEARVNDQVRNRVIVLHPSAYVSAPYMESHEFPGRSHGCITLDPGRSKEIINKLKNGSIIYITIAGEL